jgi:urease accessory protein
VTPFVAGLLHPLLVPVHLIAVMALVLLIGQQMPRWGNRAALCYAAAVAAGLIAIAFAYVPTLAEEGLLAAAAVAGLLVALAWPLPELIGIVLGAAIGLSLALDSPPEALRLSDANLTLVGTAIGAALLLFAAIQIIAHLRGDWARIGARVLGSWIAASAILVLALRFVR